MGRDYTDRTMTQFYDPEDRTIVRDEDTNRIARVDSKSQLPWSHFYVHPDGKITAFEPDACEHCGEDIQKPNSATLVEPPARLRSLGLVQSKTLPVEGYYSEKTEGEACDSCGA